MIDYYALEKELQYRQERIRSEVAALRNGPVPAPGRTRRALAAALAGLARRLDPVRWDGGVRERALLPGDIG